MIFVKVYFQNDTLWLTQKAIARLFEKGRSTRKVALTAHLIMPEGHDDKFIPSLQQALENEFGINNTTLQIENKNIEENCEIDC